MKKTLYLLFLLISLSGCLSTKVDFNTPSSMVNIIQQEILTKSTISEAGTSVTLKNVDAFIKFQSLTYNKTAVSIEPVLDFDKDTLLYVINYNNGWDIIAADKRAPIILATQNKGFFSKETMNTEVLEWIELLAADIKSLKRMGRYSSLSEDQITAIESSQQFWATICEDKVLSSTHLHDRFIPLDTIPVYPGTGHWELMGTSTTIEEYDTLKLTQTRWGQNGNNFNAYCPLIPNGGGERAPAGSTSIAGAQMLYFLHEEFGVPECAPDTAFCDVNIGNHGYIGGSSSTTWYYMFDNNINEKGCYAAAVLIADIGERVGTIYTDTLSKSPFNLRSQVFSYYGISSTQALFDESIVKQSLLSGLPVVVRSYTISLPYWAFDVVPNWDCDFIIDGYKRSRVKHSSFYEWEWDEWHGNNNAMPYIRPMTIVDYGSPYISHFRMNWGKGGEYDDVYLATSGNWCIGDSTYYAVQRKMIYGFSF